MAFGLTTAAVMAIGSAAASAGTGIAAAQSQNRALDSARRRQRQQATAAQQQTAMQAAVERRRLQSQNHLMQHRIRVAAGEAGVGMGGSMGALARQGELDAVSNLSTLQANTAGRQQAIGMGFTDQIGNLQARQMNPVLQGFMGGTQGLSTGLQIGDAVENLDQVGKNPFGFNA